MQTTETHAQRSHRRLRSAEDAMAIVEAGHRGEADAMRLVGVLIAAGIGTQVDWPTALVWTVGAAERGDPDAQAELMALTGDEGYRAHLASLQHRKRPLPQEAWRRLAAAIDWQTLVTPVMGKILCNDPLVAHVPGFASPALCEYLRTRAEPELYRATVLRAQSVDYEVDESRTNSMVSYTLSTAGLPLVAMRQKIASLVELPVASLEPTNVLHYATGEQYTHHFDSFAADVLVSHKGFSAYGQRLMTLLIYLNEEYDGGETDFPRLGLRFRGKTGEALLWRNTTDLGDVHEGSLHAGLPPHSGRKWVLSQWIREFPMPDFVGEVG